MCLVCSRRQHPRWLEWGWWAALVDGIASQIYKKAQRCERGIMHSSLLPIPLDDIDNGSQLTSRP